MKVGLWIAAGINLLLSPILLMFLMAVGTAAGGGPHRDYLGFLLLIPAHLFLSVYSLLHHWVTLPSRSKDVITVVLLCEQAPAIAIPIYMYLRFWP